MDIQYALYNRTPKKRANRLSDLSVKTGVYLRALIHGEWCYADYFPHGNLGDRSREVFLKEFHLQREDYDRKVLHHLRNDSAYRLQSPKEFKNHQLFSGIENLKSQVIKYKLFDPEDTFFHEFKHKTLRLDANGMFNKTSLGEFLKKIPKEISIEYMEDPMITTDWSDLGVTAAEDFISGSPAPVYIYKPNCEFPPQGREKIIFSGYMGSSLGFFHAYSELIKAGDLNQVHGVLVEDFYEEDISFLDGHYLETFKANPSRVQAIYDELPQLKWEDLCSI